MDYGPFCSLITCGAEEQIVDHVVLHCPIHRASTSAYPDDSGWRQSNGCSTPAPRFSTINQWIVRTGSYDEKEAFPSMERISK